MINENLLIIAWRIFGEALAKSIINSKGPVKCYIIL